MSPNKDAAVSGKAIFWHNAKQFLYIFLASLSSALSLEIFLLPSNAVVGGALGVASILDILFADGKWYLSAGIWVFVVNIPILIYSFLRHRRRFAVKTLIYVVLLSAMILTLHMLDACSLFERLMYGDGEKDKVIYILLGGALHGLSLPIMLSVNASTGGSDIVGLIVQKRSKRSSSVAMRIVMLTNVIIVGLSSLAYYLIKKDSAQAVEMLIYSVAAMFICEIVQESIFKGFSAAVELEITTEKPQELADALLAELKHGVTHVRVTGGYSHSEKTMLLCVLNKHQLTHARRIINQVDPSAFAYVENVKEVVGKGFVNKEIELDEEENGSDN